MNNKIIFIFCMSVLLLMSVSAGNVVVQDGQLNATDTAIFGKDVNATGNVTLGQKITFAFDELIDNIVNGWIRITGGLNVTGKSIFGDDLNVTGNINVTQNVTADWFEGKINASNVRNEFWIDNTQEGNLNVNKSVWWGSFNTASDLNNRILIDSLNITSGTILWARMPTFYEANISDLKDYLEDAGDTATGPLNIKLNGYAFNITNSTGSSWFYVNTTTGRVGIGTLTPQNLLNVKGDANVTGTLYAGVISGEANLNVNSSDYWDGLDNPADINAADITDDNTYMLVAGDTGTGNFIFNKNLTVDTNTLFVDSTGDKVGIGTVSPASMLNVVGAAGDQYPVRITTDQGTVLELYSTNADAATRNWAIASNYVNWGDFGIYQSATQGGQPAAAANNKFYIDNTGNVGIGTTSPTNPTGTADTVLQIEGDQTPGLVINDTGQASAWGLIANGDDLKVYYGSSSKVSFQNDGNVGIGTASPGASLHTYTASGNRQIKAESGSDGSVSLRLENSVDAWSIVNRASTSAQLQFYLDDTHIPMVINSIDGNVGIGTTSPIYTLQVGDAAGTIAIGGTPTTNSEGNLKFITSNTKKNWNIAVNQYIAGSFNIGRSTAAGGSTFTTADLTIDSLGQVGIGYANPGTAKLAINGNVGIGTTSPDSKLSIVDSGTSRLELSNESGASRQATYLNFDNANDRGVLEVYDYNAGSGLDLLINPNGGNVGIGTTTPDTPTGGAAQSGDPTLHLSGDTPLIIFEDENDNNDWRLSGGAKFQIKDITDNRIGFTLDGDGNVGIGTTSPSDKLHINGSETGGIALRLDNSASAGGEMWQIQSTGSGNTGGAGNLGIFTTGAGGYVMYLNSSGNVGIGTTGPDSLLHVYETSGDAYIKSEVTSGAGDNEVGFKSKTPNGEWITGYMIQSGSAWTLHESSPSAGARVTVLSSGNVGIGTTSPDTRLHISASEVDSGAGITIENTYTAGEKYGLYAGVPGVTNTGFSIYDNASGTAFMRIDTSGNVGIGTTTPQNTLNVVGDLNVTGTIFGAGGTNVTGDYVPYTGATKNVDLGAHNFTVDTSVLHVDSTNNKVGIGTASPSANLHIRDDSADADTEIRISNDVQGWRLKTMGSDSDKFYINSGDTNVVAIDTSGNVGIGTTSPSVKLVVGGDMGALSIENAIVISDASGVGNSEPGLWVGNSATSGPTTDVGFFKWNIAGEYVTLGTRESGDWYRDALVLKSGNVGIGTTSPTQGRLVVQGTASTPLVLGRSNGGDELWGFNIDNAAGQTRTGYFYKVSGTNNLAYAFSPDDGTTWNMVIQANGNVGIGTTSPNKILSIEATDARIEYNDSQVPEYWRVGQDGGDFSFTEVSQNLDAMVIENGTGNVGIGTTNPSYGLTVQSDVSGGIALPQIQNTEAAANSKIGWDFKTAEGETTRSRAYIVSGADTANNGFLDFYTRTSGTVTQKVRIDKSGNVGIGTTSPVSDLEIQSSSSPMITLNDNDNGFVSMSAVTGANNTAIFFDNSGDFSIRSQPRSAIGGTASDTKRLTIEGDNGNVGIGTTSPGFKLDVATSVDTVARFNSTDSRATIKISDDDTNTWLGSEDTKTFISNADDNLPAAQLVIDSSGNVGIGTTNPSYKLYVNTTGDVVSVFEDNDNPIVLLKDTNAGADLKYAGLHLNDNLLRLGKIDDAITTFTDYLTVNTSDGNVGIGTDSPGNSLHIKRTEAGAYTTPLLKIEAGSSNEDASLTFLAQGQSVTMGLDTSKASNLFTISGSTALGTNDYIVLDQTNGNVGIGTTTIPHGGIGTAKFVLEGTDSNDAGPHIQMTTPTDDYPIMQILPWRHDYVQIGFDAYFSGGTDNSADAGSNFAILKAADKLKLIYDSGVAAGSEITWNDGLVMDTSGNVGIGTTSPSYNLDVLKSTAGTSTIISSDNTDNTNAASHGLFRVATGGASGGDPYIHFTNRVVNYVMGIDNSDSDKFKVAYSSALGTTDRLTIDTSGNVGIGTTTPSQELDVAGDIRLTREIITPANLSIGSSSEASGTNSISIGSSTSATKTSSIAMGSSAAATGSYSTALGGSTDATKSFSTALGFNAQATADYTTAVGYSSDAIANYTTALGFNANTNAQYAIAIGMSAGKNPSGVNSIAIGTQTNASKSGAVAIGNNALAGGASSMAVGSTAEATGSASIALGYQADASGEGAISLGVYSDAAGDYSGAFGYGTVASAENSWTFGTSLTNSVANSFLFDGQIYADPDLDVGSDTACWSGTGAASELGECSSSVLYKENIEDIDVGLDLVQKMKPVKFDWIADGDPDVGFISEEVLKIEPRLVRVDNETGEVGGVNYRHYTAVLTKAIQEQQIQIEQLKALVCPDHPDAEVCK